MKPAHKHGSMNLWGGLSLTGAEEICFFRSAAAEPPGGVGRDTSPRPMVCRGAFALLQRLCVSFRPADHICPCGVSGRTPPLRICRKSSEKRGRRGYENLFSTAPVYSIRYTPGKCIPFRLCPQLEKCQRDSVSAHSCGSEHPHIPSPELRVPYTFFAVCVCPALGAERIYNRCLL